MKFLLITITLFVGFVYVKPDTCSASSKNNKVEGRSPLIRENPGYKVVDYDYVKEATTRDDVLIIDVREPCEVQNGAIPNSINMPIGRFAEDLDLMSEEEFSNRYNRPKPTKESEIIIYCKLGKRSTITSNQAVDLGYRNIKNYVGSWTEWITKDQ